MKMKIYFKKFVTEVIKGRKFSEAKLVSHDDADAVVAEVSVLKSEWNALSEDERLAKKEAIIAKMADIRSDMSYKSEYTGNKLVKFTFDNNVTLGLDITI